MENKGTTMNHDAQCIACSLVEDSDINQLEKIVPNV